VSTSSRVNHPTLTAADQTPAVIIRKLLQDDHAGERDEEQKSLDDASLIRKEFACDYADLKERCQGCI
jgi:hypothetical protein